MTAPSIPSRALKHCFRCGYDLHGIADEQPCPECGLLAARSRQATDALHLARPRWLRRCSIGVWLILLAMSYSVAWFVSRSWLDELWRDNPAVRRTGLGGFYPMSLPTRMDYVLSFILLNPEIWLSVAALLLIAGIWCLARPEGFEPADRADRSRRVALVICSLAPALALMLDLYQDYRGLYDWPWALARHDPMLIVTAACIPLPILLLFQLRSLAKRARSAQLAEHCAIVGIGMSAALIYAAGLLLLSDNNESLGLPQHWFDNSEVSLFLIVGISVAAILFYGWGLLLMVRFAIALGRASRQMRLEWKRDDRAANR